MIIEERARSCYAFEAQKVKQIIIRSAYTLIKYMQILL